MPYSGFSALVDTVHPVGRQDGHFYVRLLLLSRKAISAMINSVRDMSKTNILNIISPDLEVID
jgi:hypothetical protein